MESTRSVDRIEVHRLPKYQREDRSIPLVRLFQGPCMMVYHKRVSVSFEELGALKIRSQSTLCFAFSLKARSQV
jgi:hypothetical protein